MASKYSLSGGMASSSGSCISLEVRNRILSSSLCKKCLYGRGKRETYFLQAFFLPPGAKDPSLSADERPSFLAKPTLGDLGSLVLPQEWKGPCSFEVPSLYDGSKTHIIIKGTVKVTTPAGRADRRGPGDRKSRRLSVLPRGKRRFFLFLFRRF
ncbi:hypothetical protein J2Z58_000937 [Halobacillus andaensis]|nr:hypothetical protein [Halobacillus andaensis]